MPVLRLLQNLQLFGNSDQDFESTIEHFLGMGRGDDGADAGFALRHGGKADAEKLVRLAGVADHDGRDRRLAASGVESSCGKPVMIFGGGACARGGEMAAVNVRR